MRTNKLINLLIIMVILLSIGITATSIKLISLEKKVDKIDSSIVKEPIEEIPVVEEPVMPNNPPVIEEPVEPDNPPVVENPVTPINPPVIKEPDKVIVKPKYISKDKAIEIGVNKVGVGSQIIEINSDLDDNPPKYELVIQLGNYEYELEIHAITGAVIDFEKDEIDD